MVGGPSFLWVHRKSKTDDDIKKSLSSFEVKVKGNLKRVNPLAFLSAAHVHWPWQGTYNVGT